jgi:hypothetical protein
MQVMVRACGHDHLNTLAPGFFRLGLADWCRTETAMSPPADIRFAGSRAHAGDIKAR